MVAYNPTITGVFWSVSPDKPVRSLFDQTPCLKNKMKNNWKKDTQHQPLTSRHMHMQPHTCVHTRPWTHRHTQRKGHKKMFKVMITSIASVEGVFSLAQKWDKLSGVHCTSVQFITFHLCASNLGILTVSAGGWVGERMKREGNFSFNCG